MGDLLDFMTFRPALDGVAGAYFVYPIAPGLVEATSYFAQAAKEANVAAIVNLSQDCLVKLVGVEPVGIGTDTLVAIMWDSISLVPLGGRHVGSRMDVPRPNWTGLESLADGKNIIRRVDRTRLFRFLQPGARRFVRAIRRAEKCNPRVRNERDAFHISWRTSAD